MNFLQLCQDFVGQFGLAGGSGPSAVTAQVGELANVVRWIRDAALAVDNLWEDWRYLWLQYSGTIPINTSKPTVPATPSGVRVRRWETHTLKIRLATENTWSPVSFLPRAEFDAYYDPDVAAAQRPSVFTVLPDNTLQFNAPADVEYLIKGSFFRAPVTLTADGSMPLIPEEYHRIVMVRALFFYGAREDAPELIQQGMAEFPDILDKLEGAQLEGFRHRRASTLPEQYAEQRPESDYGP